MPSITMVDSTLDQLHENNPSIHRGPFTVDEIPVFEFFVVEGKVVSDEL